MLTREDITRYFEELERVLGELMKLLAERHSALVQQDITTLENLSEKETTVVSAISNLYRMKQSIFEKGNGVDEAVEQFDTGFASDIHLRRQKIRSVIAKIVDENKIQHLLLHRLLGHFSGLIKVFSGGTEGGFLYKSTGRKKSFLRSTLVNRVI